MGDSRDLESNGQPSANADADGLVGDGVLFSGIVINQTLAGLNVDLQNAATAKVDAWVDFNKDGLWQASEKILSGVAVTTGVQTLNYNVPSGMTLGQTAARVRVSTNGTPDPTGFASDGEVEDYIVSFIHPPKVESILVNGGDASRSSVETVAVTFDQVVDIDTTTGDVFRFMRTDSTETESPTPVTEIATIDHSSGKTVVSFTFNASGSWVTSSGSLVDGQYRLLIDATKVRRLGIALDGDGNGSEGGDYTTPAVDRFFRKYGDQNGNGIVDLPDFASFRSTFGKSSGQSGYLDGLDSNGDNNIGLADFAAFRASFGK